MASLIATEGNIDGSVRRTRRGATPTTRRKSIVSLWGKHAPARSEAATALTRA